MMLTAQVNNVTPARASQQGDKLQESMVPRIACPNQGEVEGNEEEDRLTSVFEALWTSRLCSSPVASGRRRRSPPADLTLGRFRIRDDHQKARSGWGGEQGDVEDKENFMVEEMRRPGSAGGWAAAVAAAESPEK
jgi:hypothetical protein